MDAHFHVYLFERKDTKGRFLSFKIAGKRELLFYDLNENDLNNKDIIVVKKDGNQFEFKAEDTNFVKISGYVYGNLPYNEELKPGELVLLVVRL